MKKIIVLFMGLLGVSLLLNATAPFSPSQMPPDSSLPPPALVLPKDATPKTGNDSATNPSSSGNMNTTPTGHTGTDDNSQSNLPPEE